MPERPIPASLILGFLGVGKTTAILDLLSRKPEDEVWAVLVNEFGEVGIDGALLAGRGAHVREIPGGCMCCVAGLPMQIGLNQLIHKARPDRLIIEPTGLGHPGQILEILNSEHYQAVLRPGPVLCLVDPRRLDEPRVLESAQFQDQVAAADVLVANKIDLCSEEQLARFHRWAAAMRPEKQRVAETTHGRLALEWLSGGGSERPLNHPDAHRHLSGGQLAEAPALEDEPWQLRSNQGEGHVSVGWRLHPGHILDETRLLAFAMDSRFVRFKAVVHTSEGWRGVNVADGALTVQSVSPGESSRLELISREMLLPDVLDRQLRLALALR